MMGGPTSNAVKVIVSAILVIGWRHLALVRRRTAEISVPAMLMDRKNTKLMMQIPQGIWSPCPVTTKPKRICSEWAYNPTQATAIRQPTQR